MSTRNSLMKNLRIVSAGLVLCSTLPASGANLGACRPTTPCPCAADGVCRPNSQTWGHYGTQWRPWPGDVIAQPQAAGPEISTEDDTLKGFLPPSPRDEDLRGPAKEKDNKKSGDDAPAEGEPLPTLPGVEIQGQLFRTPEDLQTAPLQLPIAQDVALLPEVEPTAIQAHSQNLIGEDPFAEEDPFTVMGEQADEAAISPAPGEKQSDPPPALPRFLQLPPKASTSKQLVAMPPTPQLQPALQTKNAAPAPISKNSVATKQAHAASRANLPIQQATWNESTGIQLINPAAAMAAQPSDESLQQAIYFEATDLPEEAPAR